MTLSFIEQKAVEATGLDAFKAININNVKSGVKDLLSQFGKNGIFQEYTTHDIGHVDAMLEICDRWLINEKTKQAISLADYLIITLSIYFHDVGLIVTDDEFRNRDRSSFENFKNEVLFSGQDSKDYVRSVERSIENHDERERFYYQEFIRYYHSDRIKAWIEGVDRPDLGVTIVKDIVKDLVGALPVGLRSDIAMVCQSHHSDDIGDTKKYKLNKPYGNTKPSEANLQYCAVILRTADLLHITSDRAPSLLFKLISPKNPISQREWSKQNAVTSVREKEHRNEDGEILQSDTIEVFADFDDADGFFGLDAYLTYALDQVRLSHKWIEASKIETGGKYHFPWKNIDTSNIETRGFLKEQFSFKMDEAKVLDLLTGYTLYNDPKVAIRELVQNSLDAIRLKRLSSNTGTIFKIEVAWDPQTRAVTITDNGSGMSQGTIINHFLKAGSSFYQEDDFKKEYPSFSSISRFGIGVLSCFMISDEISVTTSHPDDALARTLDLRSVHGSYLVSLKEKSTLQPEIIRGHGTSIRLRIRDSITDFDLINILRYWIIFPHCEVRYIEQGNETIIGFDFTKEAVDYALNALGISEKEEGGEDIKIETIESDGFSISYPIRYSNFLREWSFIPVNHYASNALSKLPICTCVEGIRVENGTPGFRNYCLPIAVNVSGSSAPKTNVARSGLESSKETQELMRKIYNSLNRHVILELSRIQKLPHVSFSWAIDEAYWLLAPIINSDSFAPLSETSFLNSLKDMPIILIDDSSGRKNISINDLHNFSTFWTVDWAFMESINSLIKNAPVSFTESKISQLLEGLGNGVSLPDGIRLVTTSYKTLPYSHVYQGRYVNKVVVDLNLDRVDIEWSKHEPNCFWQSCTVNITDLRRNTSNSKIFVCDDVESITGLEDYAGVISFGNLYVRGSSRLGKECKKYISTINNTSIHEKAEAITAIYVIFSLGSGHSIEDVDSIKENISRYYTSTFRARPTSDLVNTLAELTTIPEKLYSTSSKRRNGSSWAE